MVVYALFNNESGVRYIRTDKIKELIDKMEELLLDDFDWYSTELMIVKGPKGSRIPRSLETIPFQYKNARSYLSSLNLKIMPNSLSFLKEKTKNKTLLKLLS